MTKLHTASPRPVGVLGLGRSGLAAVRFLSDRGTPVIAWDQGTVPLDGVDTLANVEILNGPFPEQRLWHCESILLSPGIPRTHPGVASLITRGTPVMNDCEWLFREVQHQNPPPRFVAITGTNGKSTVTTLTGEMLAAPGFQTQTGGNLGQAALSLYHEETRMYVLELSSFQLESMHEFRADSAALLNLSPDHMDRYPRLEDYLAAKLRVFRNQRPGDVAIINTDDPGLWPAAGPAACGQGVVIVGFSIEKPVPGGVYVQDGQLIDHRGPQPQPIMEINRIRIKGRHNLANAAAAAAISLSRGASRETIARVLETFPGLPHRMQWVRTINGVDFYNDSKGTNVGAVVESLASFDRPLVLIAGGRAKKTDFSALEQAARQRLRGSVLIGEAANDLEQVLSNVAPTARAGSMKEAVATSLNLAQPGDIVLLSPACASFDMFKNFEDRGEKFSEAVHAL
ncbi:MAG: UDP-N-acetylmuramoyl-L-alanine--D-glutamate ligase [Magnetococcales bacterium]|nr:UDP-N-acetylmuramoyl-L-alanine--D-glutamate ligase [Magnetococcales bacterium]MBF0631197.1 UDP-N-acetylmuramoyl-L-alanine--D-glutamate ligase [Magnetococcales bacterium]